MLDRLESRFLLTVVVEYDPSDQTLRFFGDEHMNDVSFELPGKDSGDTLHVFVDGQQQMYSQPITRISMSMGDGADTVVVGRTTIPVFIRGGKGPDTLSGGDGDDTIYGDGGFDYIFGRHGADLLDGGLQGDTIYGHAGDDELSGGSDMADNDDTISGGDGADIVDYSHFDRGVELLIGDLSADPAVVSDFLYPDIETVRGTAFDDFIRNMHRNGTEIDGLAGNDSLRGGSGNDFLIGGPGNDTLEGTGGNDTFDAVDNAVDTIDGGGGTDSLLTFDDGLDLIALVP